MANFDIELRKSNESVLSFDCNRGIAMELQDHFSFFAPNFMHMPKYKNKMWDGKIKLVDLRTLTMPLGLHDAVLKFAKQFDYTVKPVPHISTNITLDEIEDYCESLIIYANGKKITYHDYQVKAVYYFLKYKKLIILSPTSSGKSLVLYTICRYMTEKHLSKILLIVPTIGLVHQMYSDFDMYSEKNTWSAEDNCHCITAGVKKTSSKPIYISTWQSLYKIKGNKYFNTFDVVLDDEVHLADAKSISKIMTNSTKAEYKLGVTGTLKDAKVNKMQLHGLFGPTKIMAKTKQLMDRNIVSKLKIKVISLGYNEIHRKRKRTYKEEMNFITQYTPRNIFITKLCKVLPGNTLLLFQYISHGQELKRLIEKYTDKKVFYIDGSVSGKKRDLMRAEIEKEDSCIIIASYATTSTGINIKKINSIIFGSPYKSKIKVLQSIGRALRLYDKKQMAIIFDLVDDLQWKKRKNFLLKHFFERMKYYKDEEFNFEVSRRSISE